MMNRYTLVIATLLLSAGGVHAQAVKAGDLTIERAQARATKGKIPNSAAFLHIENKGKSDDALLSAITAAAERTEVHAMSMEGDVMKMRSVDSIELKAGDKIDMKPGQGYHLMLMNLTKPLKAGDKIPMTLNFRKAGKVTVSIEVVEMGMPAKPANSDSMHDNHEHHDH